ncbi:MAG TPA: hypothetical protein VN688_27795 [Gemmataceae bacterium]|nr:hypothetical protein [Gemmataceae bacterium]
MPVDADLRVLVVDDDADTRSNLYDIATGRGRLYPHINPDAMLFTASSAAPWIATSRWSN